MDEPFSALDAPTSERLQKLFLTLQQESDLTAVIVTHRIEEAVGMGDRILIMGRETHRQPRLVVNACRTTPNTPDAEAVGQQCANLRAMLEELT